VSGLRASANELRHARLQVFRNTNATAVHARPVANPFCLRLFGHRLTVIIVQANRISQSARVTTRTLTTIAKADIRQVAGGSSRDH
jgi:hypothetical protein